AAFGGEARSRPLGGLWHWAEFKSLGTHPLPHAFVLASVNAAAAVLYWKLLDRWLPRRIAVLSALVWVVLANRGSMRLWYTTSHAVFSLVLLLAAGLIASREPFTGRRFGTVLALLVAATFLYEGGLALGGVGLLLLVWMRAERERRNLLLTITVVVLGAAGTWTLLTSPKLGTSPTPLRNATHLISSHFGEGVLPGYSTILATVTLLVVAWSLASVVLPGFKARLEERCVLVGLVVLVLGAAPFMASGFPFSTEGFFDRANLFADLGTALVYGSILAMLFRLRWPAVATALSAGVLIASSGPAHEGADDVPSPSAARRRGRVRRRLRHQRRPRPPLPHGLAVPPRSHGHRPDRVHEAGRSGVPTRWRSPGATGRRFRSAPFMNDDDGLLSLPGPRIGFDVALGLAAAIPTLAGAAFGAWLALDDWSFAAAARFNTFTQGFGTQTRQRPLSGVSDWTLFHLFGTHPVPHLMVLAVLHAAAAVLLWHLLDRWLPRRIAALTAVAWVALPNRGSTRLWVTTTPLVLSLVLLLAALFVASGVPFTGRRLGAAIGLVVLSALAYEGGIGIGVAGLLAVVW